MYKYTHKAAKELAILTDKRNTAHKFGNLSFNHYTNRHKYIHAHAHIFRSILAPCAPITPTPTLTREKSLLSVLIAEFLTDRELAKVKSQSPHIYNRLLVAATKIQQYFTQIYILNTNTKTFVHRYKRSRTTTIQISFGCCPMSLPRHIAWI